MYSSDTVAGFELSLTVSKEFYGVLEYGLMVQDQSDHWSLPVNVKVGILFNPCVYGACESSPIHRLSCTDFRRASTFEFHRCRCLPGYEGEWYQIETNECRPNPCDLMFDCEDLVAGYRCNINIAKLMAILVCVTLALGLMGFALYRRKMCYNHMMKTAPGCFPGLQDSKLSYQHRYAPEDETDPPGDFEGVEVNRAYSPDVGDTRPSNDDVMGIELSDVWVFHPPHHGRGVFGNFKKDPKITEVKV